MTPSKQVLIEMLEAMLVDWLFIQKTKLPAQHAEQLSNCIHKASALLKALRESL